MILDRQRSVRVALRPLMLFLARVRRELRLRDTDVTICLVSDAEIARMNQVFRKKHGPTDVLSFPSVERLHRRRKTPLRPVSRGPRKSKRVMPGVEDGYLGDIAISPATARRNAKRDGRPLQVELRVLILHGVLHLLGFDHETDQGQMDRMEQRLRRRLGLA